jgi:hypothetical protein
MFFAIRASRLPLDLSIQFTNLTVERFVVEPGTKGQNISFADRRVAL